MCWSPLACDLSDFLQMMGRFLKYFVVCAALIEWDLASSVIMANYPRLVLDWEKPNIRERVVT